MAKLDPFSAQLVAFVRNMPDEAILELVRNQLALIAPAASAATTPKKSKGSAKAAKTAKPSAGKRQRLTRADKQQLLADVERVVKASNGLSTGEIAAKMKISQSRVSAAVRELKASKRIFQADNRRFARYAGDANTARAASDRAHAAAKKS
jgi:ribosome-binding protein aMBF1 (putative translation factor)